jgi:hypothetical protein
VRDDRGAALTVNQDCGAASQDDRPAAAAQRDQVRPFCHPGRMQTFGK